MSSVASIIDISMAIQSTEKNPISNLSRRNSTVKGYASMINQKTKIGPSQLLVFFLNFRNSNLNIFIYFGISKILELMLQGMCEVKTNDLLLFNSLFKNEVSTV